jgi:hypothetical protein
VKILTLLSTLFCLLKTIGSFIFFYYCCIPWCTRLSQYMQLLWNSWLPWLLYCLFYYSSGPTSCYCCVFHYSWLLGLFILCYIYFLFLAIFDPSNNCLLATTSCLGTFILDLLQGLCCFVHNK